MGTHPIFESDFDCLTEHEHTDSSDNFESCLASSKFSNKVSFHPVLPNLNDFPDAHNSGKKKNPWKKTVGKAPVKAGSFGAIQSRITGFLKKTYKSYTKELSIEKLIATQIAAVVIFTIISSLFKSIFGKKKKTKIIDSEPESHEEAENLVEEKIENSENENSDLNDPEETESNTEVEKSPQAEIESEKNQESDAEKERSD